MSDSQSASAGAAPDKSHETEKLAIEAMLQRALQPIFQAVQPLVEKVALLESKLEARAFSDFQNLGTPTLDHDFDFKSRPRSEHTPFESRNHRQSLGSNATSSSQELTIRKSSFRLEKPKFENPKDSKIGGALNEAVIIFFDDCDRHIEMWKAMPENIEKTFEGSENFAIVSLPPAVQRKLAHSLEFVFAPAELCMWTEEEIAKAKFWKKVTTSEVRKLILDRKAQGVSLLAAIRTIQPPNIAWSSGVGLIHEEAFQDYKDRLINQVSQIAEGGIFLSLVSIKDAIISAIPDTNFKAELYSKFGHAGSLPGPSAFGQINELSIKSIFEFIQEHIATIKKKGLAGLVNSRAVSFSTPPSARKFSGNTSFSKVHSIDHLRPEFPESDPSFWESRQPLIESHQSHVQHPVGHALDDDEYTSVNAIARDAASKDCRHVGIGPDGKLLCPYLGNPDTAKCGFRHPSKELELKGKGVSRATPGQPKKIVHTLQSDLGISYVDDSEHSNSETHDS